MVHPLLWLIIYVYDIYYWLGLYSTVSWFWLCIIWNVLYLFNVITTIESTLFCWTMTYSKMTQIPLSFLEYLSCVSPSVSSAVSTSERISIHLSRNPSIHSLIHSPDWIVVLLCVLCPRQNHCRHRHRVGMIPFDSPLPLLFSPISIHSRIIYQMIKICFFCYVRELRENEK